MSVLLVTLIQNTSNGVAANTFRLYSPDIKTRQIFHAMHGQYFTQNNEGFWMVNGLVITSQTVLEILNSDVTNLDYQQLFLGLGPIDLDEPMTLIQIIQDKEYED